MAGHFIKTQAADGTLTTGNVTFDRQGREVLQNGDVSKVIRTSGVRHVPGVGFAVVTASGDSSDHSVAITADGGKHVDFSQTFDQSAQITHKTNAAAMFDRQFTAGDALAPGEVAKGAALVGGAADATLGVVSRVVNTKVGSGILSGSGRGGAVSGPVNTTKTQTTSQARKEWEEYFKKIGFGE